MKAKANKLAIWAAVAMMLLAAYAANVSAQAVRCDVKELTSCAEAAMRSPPKPSETCCKKLKEQESCLCEYAKNREYAQYFQSLVPVLEACKIRVPRC